MPNDEAVDRNLQGMDDLDFVGWNNADWTGVFAHHHTDDVLVLVEAAGPWFEGPRRDFPLNVGTSGGYEQRAIYIVVNRDDRVCYVGKTAPDDLAAEVAHRRILRHLRHWAKAEEWSTYWVLPLRHDVPKGVVAWLERKACRLFGVRLHNRVWRKEAACIEAERTRRAGALGA